MKKRKICSTVVAMALLVGSLYMPGNVVRTKASGYGLNNPKIEKDVVISGDDGQREEGTINNPLVKATVTTWDCIYFGNYWQEDTNGDGTVDKNDEKTPIKWRVLSVEGDDAFLLADQNLDVQRYNDTDTDVTWETCTMRSWLNGYGDSQNVCGTDYSSNNFLDNAFNAGEQSAIKTTSVVNDDNPDYGTEGGNDTSDKVYLLSIGEVTNPEYGFTSSTDSIETRKAVNTAYVAGGGEIDSEEMTGAGSTDIWWLRSPGYSSITASSVGYVDTAGNYVYDTNVAVRSALHLNLSSASDWSYAGTVSTYDYSSIWDCIYFGNYWQEDTNGDGIVDKNDEKTPIKWRVLSVDGDDAFLLADQNLDVQRYNDTDTDVTWETCTMRSWLNGYGASENVCGTDYSSNNFLDNAFNAGEQSAIKTTSVVNDDNPSYETEGGNDTSDKVYLLSTGEVTNLEYGFTSSTDHTEIREAVNTAYVAGGGEINRGDMESAGSTDTWWLRSPGHYSISASSVSSSGYVSTNGNRVDSSFSAVRPALHLNLSSASSWSYVGTVSSDGRADEEATVAPTLVPVQTPNAEDLSNPGENSGWIVNTFLDYFFKGVFSILYR